MFGLTYLLFSFLELRHLSLENISQLKLVIQSFLFHLLVSLNGCQTFCLHSSLHFLSFSFLRFQSLSEGRKTLKGVDPPESARRSRPTGVGPPELALTRWGPAAGGSQKLVNQLAPGGTRHRRSWTGFYMPSVSKLAHGKVTKMQSNVDVT